MTLRLKHISNISKGRTTAGLSNADQQGIPLINMSTLRSSLIPADWIENVSVDCYKDDIVVCWDGSNSGEFFLSNQTGALASTIGLIRITHRFDRSFIYYLLKSKEAHLRSNIVGMGIPHVNPSELKNIQIPDLDRPAQKRIATFLDRETVRIDDLIALRAAFETKVAESREALVASLLVGLPEESQRPSTTDWLENLPQEISKERAKVHFRERVELSDTGDEELLTVSHITGVTKRSEKNVNMIMAKSNEGYKLVQPKDLVVNTMWAWMGAMGVSKEAGLISPAYGIYRPISGKFLPEYIDLLVRSKPFVAEATRRSKGIHSSRLRLYPDAFLDMRLPVPTLDRQEKILAEINARAVREDALVEKNTKATELLREYRAALITAAVTGQIDVDTYGHAGAPSATLDQIEEEMQG